MKKLIILTAVIFSSLSLWAQNENMNIEHVKIRTSMPATFSFGTRVGMNYSNITSREMSGVDGIPGFVLGGFAEIRMAKWFSTSIDILYSSQGYDYEGDDYDRANFVSSNIIVPVLANFYVVGELALKVGIQPSMLMNMRVTKDQKASTVTSDFQRFSLDIPVGLSYTLWKSFKVDLRYNIGLLNMRISDQAKMYNSTISLSVGYKF